MALAFSPTPAIDRVYVPAGPDRVAGACCVDRLAQRAVAGAGAVVGVSGLVTVRVAAAVRPGAVHGANAIAARARPSAPRIIPGIPTHQRILSGLPGDAPTGAAGQRFGSHAPGRAATERLASGAHRAVRRFSVARGHVGKVESVTICERSASNVLGGQVQRRHPGTWRGRTTRRLPLARRPAKAPDAAWALAARGRAPLRTVALCREGV